MKSSACVDANIVIKLVVEEVDSVLADALWESWVQNEVQIMAPALLRYEVTAVLRKKVYQNQLSLTMAGKALSAAFALLAQNVDLVTLAVEQHRRAWELACRFNRPTAYDAHYLALAETEACEFWTADERLYNSVKDDFPLIRWLGEPTGR